MAEKQAPKHKIVADNRKARFHYEIGEVFEAGIMLTGTEVKALRLGRATIAESYADTKRGELWLINANIPEYLQGEAAKTTRAQAGPRKLLLHKREIGKLASAVEREGMTLVALEDVFQRARPRESRSCGRQRQEAP